MDGLGRWASDRWRLAGQVEGLPICPGDYRSGPSVPGFIPRAPPGSQWSPGAGHAPRQAPPLAAGPGASGRGGGSWPGLSCLAAPSGLCPRWPPPSPTPPPPGPAGGWRETVHLVTSRCLAPSGPPGESGYCHYPHLTTREAETHVVTEMSRPRTPVGCSVSTGLRCLPLALSVTLSSRRGRWPSGDHPGGSGFKSWLCRLLAVLPWAGPFASWSLPLLNRPVGGRGGVVKMEPPSTD